MKKLTLIAALLLCLAMSLNACSSYRDDVAVNDITSAIINNVSTQGGFTATDADYVSLEFANPDVISANVSEWMICASTSSQTVDEFGVFHVKNGGDIDAVTDEIWDYLHAQQVKLEVYLEKYDPAEKPKLQNVQISTYGNYIVYTMLNESDTAATQVAVKDALTQK